MKGYEGSLNHHSKQFGGSHTKGGQVEVHHTADGDRRDGTNDRRGCVSPLGGVSNPSRGDMSRGEEAKDRAQSPRRISESGIFDRFRNPKSGPI
jgi:hypothetical protein